jgi:hypothetical protein
MKRASVILTLAYLLAFAGKDEVGARTRGAGAGRLPPERVARLSALPGSGMQVPAGPSKLFAARRDARLLRAQAGGEVAAWIQTPAEVNRQCGGVVDKDEFPVDRFIAASSSAENMGGGFSGGCVFDCLSCTAGCNFPPFPAGRYGCMEACFSRFLLCLRQTS